MPSFALLNHAPIPVGHRVELRWYESPTGGIFGNKPEVREAEPRVIDLDTGVEFGPMWLYTQADGIRPLRSVPLQGSILPHLREVKVVTGVVRRCRVSVWNSGGGEAFLQTDLDIE